MKRIALLAKPFFEVARGILRGVRSYEGMDEPWVYQVNVPDKATLEALCRKEVSGAIGYLKPSQAAVLSSAGLPVVLAGGYPSPQSAGLPHVFADNLKIAQQARDHFMTNGLTNVAYVGPEVHPAAKAREQSFVQAVHACGEMQFCGSLALPFAPDDPSWPTRSRKIVGWLADLPKPVGVYCFFDPFGMEVVNACREGGWAVPDEIAVLGTDNDSVHCQLSAPMLSSVDLGAAAIGLKAAELLNRLLAGDRSVPKVVPVPPIGVVQRASTDRYSYPDPDVVAALRFMHANVAKHISVQDVLDHVLICRRALENKFKVYLKCSPRQELERLRIQLARKLLVETDAKLVELARGAGFASMTRFYATFRKATGMSPQAYRALHSKKDSE